MMGARYQEQQLEEADTTTQAYEIVRVWLECVGTLRGCSRLCVCL